MRQRDVPAAVRLMTQLVPQPNGCWHWTGYVNPQGYGRIGYRGRTSVPVQQAVYAEFVGPIPVGMVIDHRCHTDDHGCWGTASCMHRRCGNPNHLEAVTPAENSSRGAFGRRTHCPHGHEYSPENTYRSGGRRFCKTCNQRHGAARRQRLREARA